MTTNHMKIRAGLMGKWGLHKTYGACMIIGRAPDLAGQIIVALPKASSHGGADLRRVNVDDLDFNVTAKPTTRADT